jgi:hypothetical protein
VNKSVPTMLGIVIILLVVVLVVLFINYRTTQAIGRGERIVSTVGGELLTGEEAPREFIDETSATSRTPEVEAKQSPMVTDPVARERQQERKAQIDERRRAAQEGETPPGPMPLPEGRSGQ